MRSSASGSSGRTSSRFELRGVHEVPGHAAHPGVLEGPGLAAHCHEDHGEASLTSRRESSTNRSATFVAQMLFYQKVKQNSVTYRWAVGQVIVFDCL